MKSHKLAFESYMHRCSLFVPLHAMNVHTHSGLFIILKKCKKKCRKLRAKTHRNQFELNSFVSYPTN